MQQLVPQGIEELAEMVRSCAASRTPLEIVGGASKLAVGAPVKARAQLSLASLRGVQMYEPEELVFTADAGTPLAEIEDMLAAKGQMLPFEPPDFSDVLATFAEAPAQDAAPTLGGTVACGFSGPMQVRHWALRDHVLGMQAVNGAGEVFNSGGRVVKNVTGYDLPRLLTASFGTLAVLARITVRVLPAAERTMTLLATGHDAPQAFAALSDALLTPAEASGAACLPAALSTDGTPRTCVRLQGFAATLRARAEWLREKLAAHGSWQLLDDEESRALWRDIRDARPLSEWAQRQPDKWWLWRLSGPARRAADLLREIDARYPGTPWLADRAGGLVWLALPQPAPADAPAAALDLRALALQHGAQAMLFAAPAQLRAQVPPFPPQPAAVAGIAARLRAAFDPAGILNPGRMPLATLDETIPQPQAG